MRTACIRLAGVATAATLILIFLAVGPITGKTPATHPAPRPAPTTASAPAPVKYPSDKLTAACKHTGRLLRDRLDAKFRIVVSEPFVVAGAMPAERLSRHINGSVLAPAKAMWTSYFKNKPTKPITVLLFTGDKEYRTWAAKLFKDQNLPHFGYYRQQDRTLVMNISTGTGTLVHELTHALIVYDFPDVPTWFNEGLASLHEQCSVGAKKIVGLTNWRLPALQRAITVRKLRPLRDMVTKRDFYGRLRGLNYAQGRYFVMYMQKQGLLQKFYAHFRKNHKSVNADIKAIEHVFGGTRARTRTKTLAQIEKAYLTWVMTLRFGR